MTEIPDLPPVARPARPPSGAIRVPRPSRAHAFLPWLSAVLSGLALALAHPQFGYSFLAWIAWVPLLQALDFPETRPGKRLLLGWLAGFVAAAALDEFSLLPATAAGWAGAGVPVGIFGAAA